MGSLGNYKENFKFALATHLKKDFIVMFVFNASQIFAGYMGNTSPLHALS